MQILVIEDDHDIREVVVELLSDAGYDVVEAANGLEALQALDAGLRPAALVLDLMMPVLDGYGVLKGLRERGLATPVLVASASHQGPAGLPFLMKPYDGRELVRQVDLLLCQPTAAQR